MSVLEIDGLSVVYRGRRRSQFTAVDDVSLEIGAGRTLALVGESGSGKTSIGRAVLGLAPTSAGVVRFRGVDLTGGAGHVSRRGIQAVFQDPFASLSPTRTIGDTLLEPMLAIDRRSARGSRDRIVELLERTGLDASMLDRLPHEFSGGQRQRIAIARALSVRPELIICDEPVSALDLSTQRLVLDLLVDVQRENGVSYLFVTHDLSVVRYISHDVAVLRAGHIVERGRTDRVVETPEADYTRQLLLASPLPDVDRQAERRRRRLATSSQTTP